jgi:glycosyltransferase involved in cell wall biosynthesis
MREPLVSVLMMTYNHIAYIAQAIEGVLRQKVSFPIELVIGEDCSTDGTREVALEYQQRYPDIIRVLAWEKNVGMTRNGYDTTKACRGKYIAFCEGDDYWHHPDKLQRQADHLESHPECGLVFSSYDVYDVASKRLIRDFLRHRKWEMPSNPNIWDLFNRQFPIILTCTVMTRRVLSWQIIDADPYLHQSNTFLMGDAQHWVEMAALARVHYIAESLATHNITKESATRSKDIKKVLRFNISNAEVFLYLCDKYKFPPKIRAAYQAAWFGSSLQLAFHSRNAELADEVRRTKETFTWKDWLRYYGARNVAIFYICRIGSLLLGLLKKNRTKLWGISVPASDFDSTATRRHNPP